MPGAADCIFRDRQLRGRNPEPELAGVLRPPRGRVWRPILPGLRRRRTLLCPLYVSRRIQLSHRQPRLWPSDEVAGRTGVVDILVTVEMERISTDTGSGEMTDTMHMVREYTVDLRPVAAGALLDILMRTRDNFKGRPVISLKVSPDPEIASEVAIAAVGEGNGHHRHGTTHRHHRQL